MKISLLVTPDGLKPMYPADFDECKKLKVGEEVVADIQPPRNIRHHRKFFAFLRLVLDSAPDTYVINGRKEETPQSIPKLLDWIKIKTGHFTPMCVGDEVYPQPDSISFEKMNEAEFSVFYDRALDVVLSVLLRGVSKEQIEEEYINYL